jgi:hypothetical protein
MNYTKLKCKWFKLYELLPPEIYCDEDHGWDMLCDRLKQTIDYCRELFNAPLVINDWKNKGHRQNCGFRTKTCAVGAKFSAHKQGMAADIICSRLSAAQMRKILHDNADKLPFKVRLEANVSWLHIDVRTDGQTEKIKEFKA